MNNYRNQKASNIDIFNDTKNLCESYGVLKKSIQNSIQTQSIILEADDVQVEKSSNKNAKVIVSKKRTLEAAKNYAGNNVGVLNFASATNPGGGVIKGSSAQEECICRCSTLYFCLQDCMTNFYVPHRKETNPIHNDDCIFTPNVKVFKTDTAKPEKMEEKDWYDINVITCAAPNLRENPSNQMNYDGNKAVKLTDKELLAVQEKRLRRILDIAVVNNISHIILGAFGCGAFNNKPEVVALAAKNVVKDYIHCFDVIEFAIYCSKKDDKNFQTFNRVLSVYAK